jgi:hypothetical protein
MANTPIIPAKDYKALVEASKKEASNRHIQRIHKQFTDWLTCNGLAFVREYQFDKANKRKWRIRVRIRYWKLSGKYQLALQSIGKGFDLELIYSFKVGDKLANC